MSDDWQLSSGTVEFRQAERDHANAGPDRVRDPFDDGTLGRLIASNQHYQRTHGHYIVPLAERLLAARAEIRELRKRAK